MKRIPLTAEITANLRRAYGADADLSAMVVYEVVMANTNPIRKKGLYEGARLQENTLNELVAAVNAESIPLLHSHNSENLAFGRVFFAARSYSEARALIALSSKEHPEMIDKLDSGTLDQVSIGLLPQHLNCSQCGFDYLGADATWENVMGQTCPEGHTIGVDGTHLKIDGVDMFYELSIVSQGGLQGARVVGSSDSMFSRLAASNGKDAGALLPFVLHCSAEDAPNDEPADTPATDEPADAGDEPAPAAGDSADAGDEPAPAAGDSADAGETAQGELFASLVQASAKAVADVMVKLTTAEATVASQKLELEQLRAQVATANTQVTSAQKALLSVTRKTQVALTGKSTVEDTASIDILLATLEEDQTKLGSVFIIGGAAKATKLDSKPAGKSAAFTTLRK